ncbi:hypothetical protein [Nostoc sp.]|uniref:hypothetical protein n=1 Tax=Nostoc sp. TaxID=1180 RepID=UPI002FF2DB64
MTLLRPYRHGNSSSGEPLRSWGLPKWSKWRGKPCWCEPLPLGEDRTASPEMLWQTVTAHNNPIV